MMSENRGPVRVAVNVMRARLTVIGFNIAIVSFQIVQMPRLSGGISVQGVDHPVHVGAYMALFMALALSLISLIVFIMSCALDDVGVCNHWSLVAGDLLMYLALAHTVSGFFAPLEGVMRTFAGRVPLQEAEALVLHKAVLVTSGFAWFLAIYGGALVSLVRSPFPRQTNFALGIAYLVLLLVLAWVNSQATMIEAVSLGEKPDMFVSVLRELVQPLRW